MSSLVALAVCLLAPPTPDSITEAVIADSRFRMLHRVLRATGMDTILDRKAPSYTLFAPTDAAFQKLPRPILNELLTRDGLSYPLAGAHILEGKYGIESFTNGTAPLGQPLRHRLKTWGDTYLHTEVSRSGRLTANGAKVVEQIHTPNGNILVIDTVMPAIIDPPRPNGLSRSLPSELFQWSLGKYERPKGTFRNWKKMQIDSY